MSLLDVDAANRFITGAFPGARSEHPEVVALEPGFARLRLRADASHMRPGDMINGPTQMTLADTAAYVCVFTRAGIEPMAVTSSLDMHFLRPCIGPLVTVEARMLRFGRKLAVMDVRVFGEGHAEPSAAAIVSYARA